MNTHTHEPPPRVGVEGHLGGAEVPVGEAVGVEVGQAAEHLPPDPLQLRGRADLRETGERARAAERDH